MKPEQLKVLHVVRQFYPVIGGLENYVLNLAVNQISQGYSVRVITLNRDFPYNKILKPYEVHPSGIEIIRIPFFFSKKYPLAFKVLKYLKGYDIINVHAVDFFSDFLALTKVFHRKKIVLITHGGFFHTNRGLMFKKFYFHTITRLFIRFYNAVIGCSENDIKLFRKITPKITLVHNGVNIQPYLNTAKTYKRNDLLYVGRLDTHKGVDKLIKLVALLREKGFPVNLIIAGPDSGKLRPSLEKLADDLKIAENVTFKGPVSDNELIELYSGAFLFLSASGYEGFGISAVEAMASGTLCGLNNIESFRFLLSGKVFGVLCDFNDLEGTASGLRGLLEISSEDYNKLSQEAREFAKNFSWENTSDKINEIYDRVLSSS